MTEVLCGKLSHTIRVCGEEVPMANHEKVKFGSWLKAVQPLVAKASLILREVGSSEQGSNREWPIRGEGSTKDNNKKFKDGPLEHRIDSDKKNKDKVGICNVERMEERSRQALV
ncbi:conserved hypothetical protein [Ricinus communis]|uniref:Uncharacterized protein n=1 Tax=Ricinus communis TaxID=3988 RepID=B9RPM9_RICCO|nr:conserved hypothetical protein [Ricinus communis]